MTEYEENDKFTRDVKAVADDKSIAEFGLIREQEIKLKCLLCIRTDKEGEHVQGSGPAITCKRIPPVYQLLVGCHYVVIGDYYRWTHDDERKKSAAIHHALSAIEVDKGEKGIKLKIRKPDIQEYSTTAMRYGPYTDELKCLQESEMFTEAFKASAKQLVEGRKPKT